MLNSLAKIDLQEGAYAEAGSLLEQADPLYQGLFGSASIERIETIRNLATVLALQGRTRLAIDHFQQALDLCQEAVTAKEPRAADVLAALQLHLISLYRSQRNYKAAAEHCEQALLDYRRDHPGHEQVLMLFYLAAGSLRLAQYESQPFATTNRADLAAAETLSAEAIALGVQAGLNGKPAGTNIDVLAGVIALDRNDLNTAESLFQNALQVGVTAKQPALEAKCLTWLAETQLRRAQAAEADGRRTALSGSLELARRAGVAMKDSTAYSSQQFMADLVAAKAQRQLGERQAAIATLTQAVRKIESPATAATGTDSDREEFFSALVDAFDLLVDWNLTDGHPLDALTAAETSRNHAYLDHLRLASVDARPVSAPTGDLAREQHATIVAYHQAVRRLREVSDQPGSDDLIHKMVAEIGGLRTKYAHIETAMRDASPYCRELWGDRAMAPDWSTLGAKILEPDNLLLFYYLGHAKSHLLIVSRGASSDRSVALRVESFELQVPVNLAKRAGVAAGPLTRSSAAQLGSLEWMALSDLHAAEAHRGSPCRRSKWS